MSRSIAAAFLLLLVAMSAIAQVGPGEMGGPETGDKGDYLDDETYEMSLKARDGGGASAGDFGNAWRRGSNDGESGASVQFHDTVEFRCAGKKNRQGLSSGVQIRTTRACDAGGVTLQRCDTVVDYGRACSSGDWSDAFEVESGATTRNGNMDISAECDPSRCTLEITQHSELMADPRGAAERGRIKTQRQKKEAEESGNPSLVVNQVTELDKNPRYNQERATSGYQYAEDYQTTYQAAHAGEIRDYTGEKLGTFDEDFVADACKKHCIERSEEVVTEHRTCETSVPHDKYTCRETKGTHTCRDVLLSDETTCSEKREIETLVCDVSWPEDQARPVRNCPGFDEDPTCGERTRNIACDSDRVFDTDEGTCSASASCPVGVNPETGEDLAFEYNDDAEECVAEYAACPDNFDLNGDQCERTDLCPMSGFDYNADTDQCEKPVSTCPEDGYELSEDGQQCEKLGPTCASGGRYDEASGMCEVSYQGCPDGGAYDSETQTCIEPVECPSGYVPAGESDEAVCVEDTPECRPGGVGDGGAGTGTGAPGEQVLFTADFDDVGQVDVDPVTGVHTVTYEAESPEHGSDCDNQIVGALTVNKADVQDGLVFQSGTAGSGMGISINGEVVFNTSNACNEAIPEGNPVSEHNVDLLPYLSDGENPILVVFRGLKGTARFKPAAGCAYTGDTGDLCPDGAEISDDNPPVCESDSGYVTEQRDPVEGVVDTRDVTEGVEQQPVNPELITQESTQKTKTKTPDFESSEEHDIAGCTFTGTSCPDDDPYCEDTTLYGYDCQSEGGDAACETDDPVINAGYKHENIFDREYNDNDSLVAWKQGFSRPKDWAYQGSCEAADDSLCTRIGVTCTLDEDLERDGVVAQYDCREREATFACDNGTKVNSCDAPGDLPEGTCDATTETCESVRTMDARVCHIERRDDTRAFECKPDYDHDKEDNTCFIEPFCPDGYSSDTESGAPRCVLDNPACPDEHGVSDADVIEVMDHKVNTPYGGTTGHWFDLTDNTFEMGFSQGHGGDICGGSYWDARVRINIDNIDEVGEFVLEYLDWNDQIRVFVNDTKAYESPGNCITGDIGGDTPEIDLVDSLEEGENIVRFEIRSGPSSARGVTRFRFTRACSIPSSCADDNATLSFDGRCELEGEPVGDGHQTVPQRECESGYKKEGEFCLARGCDGPTDSVAAEENIQTVKSQIERSNGRNSPIPTQWEDGGNTLLLEYRDNATTQGCEVGEDIVYEFKLPYGASQIAEMRLASLQYVGNVSVRLNGAYVYESGEPGCNGDSGGIQTVDRDLSFNLKSGTNRLVFNVRNHSGTLAELQARIAFESSCTLQASNEREVNTAEACELVSQDSGEDGETFVYRCGEEPALKSSCRDGEVAGMEFEKRINEETDDQGRITSYDEVYVTNETTSGAACAPEARKDSCEVIDTECIDPGPKIIDGVEISRSCFKEKTTYSCTRANGALCDAGPPPGDCTASGERCVRRDPATDECIAHETIYVCDETGATQSCNTPPADAQCASPTSGCVRENAFGDCIEEVTSTACYSGTPNRCESSSKCEYQESECIAEENGVCTRVQQSYLCSKTEVSCEKTASICESGDSPFDEEGFGKVTGAMAQADQIKKGMGSSDAGKLTIFEGRPRACSDTTGGDVLGANCCNLNADDESLLYKACNQKEKDLAAARRSGRTHYVGRFCATSLPIIGCVKHTEGHCEFDSVLGRLVQEQGRPQLREIMASGDTEPQETRITTPYMAPDQGWDASATLGPDHVYVWTWDQVCKDDAGKDAYMRDVSCPSGDTVWVAHCRGGDCDPSGLRPPHKYPGNQDWDYYQLDAGGGRGVQMGDNAQIAGGCERIEADSEDEADTFGTCDLKFTQWPRGRAGNARVSMDIGWQMFRPKGTPGNWNADVRDFGRFSFQPYQADRVDDGRTFPDEIPIRVAVDGNAFEQFTIPSDLPEDGLRLNTSPPTRLFGECDIDYNYCDVQAITESKLTDKEWCPGCGDPETENLDCSGFTIEQFTALDLSKMDLREFTRRIEPSEPPSADDFASDAEDAAADFESDFENSAERQPQDRGQQVMRASPLDGRPPYRVTLDLADRLPADDGDVPVTGISIDWGDGDSQSVGPGASVQHTYTEDDGYREFTINATFQAENGVTRTTRAKVVSWKDDPPSYSGPLGGGNINADSYKPDDTSSDYRQGDLTQPRFD